MSCLLLPCVHSRIATENYRSLSGRLQTCKVSLRPSTFGVRPLGKADLEAAATARFRLDRHGPPMRFDDRLHQAETKAEATSRTALIAAVEAGPDVLKLVRRNTDPCILD